MNPALRKYGINESLLDEICILARRNPDPTSMIEEGLPLYPGSENMPNGPMYLPVSVEFVKAFNKPKKIYNTLIKLNIFNIVSTDTKPGFYTFTCKAYDGSIYTTDIKKESWLSYKRACERALLGFADQILELKVIKAALAKKESDDRREKLRTELGIDNLDIPDTVPVTDELIDSIGEILNEIDNKQKFESRVTDVVDAEFTEVN